MVNSNRINNVSNLKFIRPPICFAVAQIGSIIYINQETINSVYLKNCRIASIEIRINGQHALR